jgi:hypothetical protein
MSEPRRLYRIAFFNQGQLYEIYARRVSQGGLLGFVEVEELVFGETTTVVVDPTEERLRSEFSGVRRTYIPMHAVVRIDEVEKQGQSRISEPASHEGNVMAFPVPIYRPGPGGKDS